MNWWKRSPLLTYLACALLGALAFIAINQWILPAVRSVTQGSHPYDKNIAIESTAIWNDDAALYSYIKKFGGKQTIAHLNELTVKFGDCHQNAHKAGRMGYELFGEKAFREGGAECHSGWYHGATEAFFKEKGTANLTENLRTLCSSELNPFFSHQCIHGIGHGLMAWASYDLPEALKSCDLLPERKDSCWTGVFMENIVGGLAKDDVEKSTSEDAAAHFTNYLSKDPLYPCDDPTLGDVYRGSCYFLQTSRMIQLFGADFKKVGETCAKAPAEYQRSCFASMGRDIGGSLRGHPVNEIAACTYAPAGALRIECLNGAVQDAFWDPTGQSAAIAFCTLLTEKTEKDSCYQTIIGRAPDILSDTKAKENFCASLEPAYEPNCRTTILR